MAKYYLVRPKHMSERRERFLGCIGEQSVKRTTSRRRRKYRRGEMMVFKCKMCGGDIVATEGAVFGTCDSCGITSTLPKATDEKLVNLFNRANHFRRLNEFDRALGAYESILTEDNTNAEAHWCVALCRYGIEYVEDPKTGEHVPTCHRASHEPIVTDADYLAALEHAEDGYARELYETQAKKINEIQKNILAISSREEPFDVFICYKETTDGGSRTKDSVIAQDIHDALTKEGLRVFFARITLENMLGAQYEPYIFGALNTARVMLVIGTQKELFNAVWVRNEWSRFLAIMKKDKTKVIVPCYRDMDAYDLPEELSMYQSQDMGKIGFIQDLIRGVKKITDAGKKKEAHAASSVATSQGVSATVDSLLKRVFMFLEDGDFTQAAQYAEKVLDADPENAKAYVGKLLIELKLKREENLGERNEIIPDDNDNYKKARKFADANYRAQLEGYNVKNRERHMQNWYDELCSIMEHVNTEKEFSDLAKQFRATNGYKDTASLAADCEAKAEQLMKIRSENQALLVKKAERRKRLAITAISVVLFAAVIVFISGKVIDYSKGGYVKYSNGDTLRIPYGTTEIAYSHTIYEFTEGLINTQHPKNAGRIYDLVIKITSLKIPDGVTTIGNRAFYVSELTSVTIPDGVTYIGDEAFAQSENLASVTIPDSVTHIGDGAFWITASDFTIICSRNSYAAEYAELISASVKYTD